MPKAIDDLRSIILREARPILLKKGYDHLTIRAVANACGIASGTIYHYFDSKDDLAIQIMESDWKPTIERIGLFTGTVCSPIEGLRMAVGCTREFICVYSTAWVQYRAMYRSSPSLCKLHKEMIRDLDSVIGPMMLRFDPALEPILSEFLAQTVMAIAAENDQIFDRLLPVFERLCR